MKKLIFFTLIGFLACTPNPEYFRNPASSEPRYSLDMLSLSNEMKVSKYASSLPEEKLTVLIDVDDTVLLSSAAYRSGVTTYGRDIVSASCDVDPTNLSKREKRSFDEFWEKMNTEFVAYSIVRPEAVSLVKIHSNRGDNIIMVTDRYKSDDEELTDFLEKELSIRLSKPVLFTECGGLTRVLRKNKADIVISDSDEDLAEGKEAGARIVRLPRSNLSINQNKEEIGSLSETVIVE